MKCEIVESFSVNTVKICIEVRDELYHFFPETRYLGLGIKIYLFQVWGRGEEVHSSAEVVAPQRVVKDGWNGGGNRWAAVLGMSWSLTEAVITFGDARGKLV